MRIALRLPGVLALGLLASAAVGCRDSSASSTAAAPSAEASAEPKDTNLPGVDTSAMTPRERHEWSALVGELLAPCPNVPVPVAQCVLEKRPCALCVKAAKWIAGAVRNGVPEDYVRRTYKERFDPGTVKTIPVDGSPTEGPEDAPVTLVELADFECPHCRDAVPVIDAVMAAHPGKVRLIYKSYTLGFHVRGEPAARAAFAAGEQGRFWEMEHLLFARQQQLEDANLEQYARMLKLDIPKWKADMESPAIKDRVARDRKVGEDLKLKGTPTIYINGRELDVEQDESLEDRVASELGIAPAPRPTAAAPAKSQ